MCTTGLTSLPPQGSCPGAQCSAPLPLLCPPCLGGPLFKARTRDSVFPRPKGTVTLGLGHQEDWTLPPGLRELVRVSLPLGMRFQGILGGLFMGQVHLCVPWTESVLSKHNLNGKKRLALPTLLGCAEERQFTGFD